MAHNFRSLFKFLVPSWLSSDDGGKVLHALATIQDAFVQRAREGLEARFPSRAGDSALEEIGRDRGIYRGRSETREHYAARLRAYRWPRGHRTRGSAYALLEQIREYFGRAYVWSVDVAGNRDEVTAHDGTETSSRGNAWDWDSEAPVPYTGKAKFWVVLQGPTAGASAHPSFSAGAWGPTLKNPNTTLGIAGWTSEDGRAIKRLFRRPAWHPAGTYPQMMIVELSEAGGEPVPDGFWYRWSKLDGTNQTRARATGFRLFSLLT